MKKSFMIKAAAVLALSGTLSATSAQAGCNNGSLYCNSGSSHSSYNSYSTGSNMSYVPFSSTGSMSGPLSISGLGANEYLNPTSCPVNVNGLGSGQQVLGCYNVMKRTRTVNYHVAPHRVQVVRPVIYVRYPVPTPVYTMPVPVPTPVYHMPVRPMPSCGMPMMPPRPMMYGRGYCG